MDTKIHTFWITNHTDEIKHVLEVGVNHGGEGKVIEKTDSAIAIKWPSTTVSTGSGSGEREYFPPRTCVYNIESENSYIYCTKIIEWQNSRKNKTS